MLWVLFVGLITVSGYSTLHSKELSQWMEARRRQQTRNSNRGYRHFLYLIKNKRAGEVIIMKEVIQRRSCRHWLDQGATEGPSEQRRRHLVAWLWASGSFLMNIYKVWGSEHPEMFQITSGERESCLIRRRRWIIAEGHTQCLVAASVLPVWHRDQQRGNVNPFLAFPNGN